MPVAIGTQSNAGLVELVSRAIESKGQAPEADRRLVLFLAALDIFGRPLISGTDPDELDEILDELTLDPRFEGLMEQFALAEGGGHAPRSSNSCDIVTSVMRVVGPELDADVHRAFRLFDALNEATDRMTIENAELLAAFFSRKPTSLDAIAYDFTIPVPLKAAIFGHLKVSLLLLGFVALIRGEPGVEHWVGAALIDRMTQHATAALRLQMAITADAALAKQLGIEPLDLGALGSKRAKLVRGLDGMVERARQSGEAIHDPRLDTKSRP